jgi:hypothetical protein
MADERRKQEKRERQWAELNEYRDLLQPPPTYEDGFTRNTLIGALFIALIMTPGQIYLNLVTGAGIGDAAQWVTVILFLEIAKRSFTTLRRQEIYLLTYVAVSLISQADTGTFLNLIKRQYYVGSQQMQEFGLTERLVNLKFMGLPWYSPAPDSPAIIGRSFLHTDWALPIILMVIGIIVGRVTWFTSGYVLFRLVSDREHLPFPTAPMSALSSMALAEESGSEGGTWKWSCFAIGGTIGLVFGLVYIGIPAFTEVFAGAKVTIIPIPFVDLTPSLGPYIMGTPLAISFSLGPIFSGFLLPFWSVMGSFTGVVLFMVSSPIVQHYGLMPRWKPGLDAIQTSIASSVDFWQAFSLGVTIAVFVISIIQMVQAGRQAREDKKAKGGAAADPYGGICRHPDCQRPAQVRGYCLRHLGRGDFNLWLCLAIFFLFAAYPIVLAKTLFPVLVSTGLLVFFLVMAFVYAPLMSFVSARLDGMIGQSIRIPYLHEAVVFLTGYRGVEIWFVPFPGADFGGNAAQFRVVELTGMKFTSLLKAELVMVPLVLGASLVYWSFLWKMAPIPSEAYPYAQKFWPLDAFNQAVYLSSTSYSTMWRAGEEVDGRRVQHHEAVWSPSNLQDDRLHYWRVRVTRQVDVPNPAKRQYGPWSRVGYFYTDFGGDGVEQVAPRAPQQELESLDTRRLAVGLPAADLVGLDAGQVVREPNPNLPAAIVGSCPDSLEFLFQIDTRPEFDSDFVQTSTDIPMFFKTLWKDLDYTGDRADDDLDGRVDEEYYNHKDDDGDALIDEDCHHPLEGRKWPLAVFGAVFGLGFYGVLNLIGMPMFFIFGYIRSVVSGPTALFTMMTEVIGALAARRYFWPRFGTQQWRQFAMVMAVGFGVGMSLVGMICAALQMIDKAISVSTF